MKKKRSSVKLPSVAFAGSKKAKLKTKGMKMKRAAKSSVAKALS